MARESRWGRPTLVERLRTQSTDRLWLQPC